MLGFSYVQDGEERLQTQAKERMSDILSANKERCAECTGDVIIGEPVDTIVDFAKEKDADMLIISTHGAKRLEKILLGSVAERVLKRVHCPVLFMNPYKHK
jgi:nucleotide-binding universal stress UspA family protein